MVSLLHHQITRAALADRSPSKFKLLFLAAVGAAAVSLPIVEPRADEIEARATCVYTCGTVCYWQEDIDEALAQGYADFKSGSAPGTFSQIHPLFSFSRTFGLT